MWSEYVVNIPGKGKVAKAIAHSKILKVRTDSAEEKFDSMMKKYNELKLYLIKDLNPTINSLLKYIFTKKNEGLSFNKKSMVSTHKKIYKARNKLYQRLFGIKQKKTANNFLRSVEKTIELRKMDKKTLDKDITEDSVSKKRDTENVKMNVRDMAGFFSRSRNVLALRCPRGFGGKRIECLVKQFRKKEKSYNNALVKFELARDKFHTFIDPFVDRAGDQTVMEALEDSGRQITLQDEYVPQDFKDKKTEITTIFNDAVNNIYSRVTELNKKMKQFFDEDFPTVGILRYNFTGVKYKTRWVKYLGLPGSYGSKMKRNRISGESSDGQTKVELDSRAAGNLKINRNNFMKIFVKLNDIYSFLTHEKFSETSIMTLAGEKVYQLIYGRFNDIDKLLAKIVGLNTDNIRRICRKDLGALTSSDNYIRGMDNIMLGVSQKQEKLDVDAKADKTALNEAGESQSGGKQTKANLRKQGIYRQYKLPVFIENRFLSAVLKKEDIKDKNLSVRKFTYSQLGLYNPSRDENPNVSFQDKIIVPYSFYSAAIYEPHIFSADDVLFGTLAFILGRENEIIGAEMGNSAADKIRHESLINSIDKLRIELGVKDQPKFSDNSSKRENRQKMSIVRYYALFFSSVIEYYVYFLKMQIDKFVVCNLLNYCLKLDSIPNNVNENNTPDGTPKVPEENIGMDNINSELNQLGGGNEKYTAFLDKLKGSQEISDPKPILDLSTQVMEKDGELDTIINEFNKTPTPTLTFIDWKPSSATSATPSATSATPSATSSTPSATSSSPTNMDQTIYNQLKQKSFKFQQNLPLQPNGIIKSDLNIYLQNRFFIGETRLIDILNTLAGNTRVFVPGATGDFRYDEGREEMASKTKLDEARKNEDISGGALKGGNDPIEIKSKFIGKYPNDGNRFYQTFADDTKIASNKFANILPKGFFINNKSGNNKSGNDKLFNEKLLSNVNYTNFVTNYKSNHSEEFKNFINNKIKGIKKMEKLSYNFDLENSFYANLETEFFKLMPLLDLSKVDVVGTSLETMIQQEIIDEAMAKLDIEKEFEKQNEREEEEQKLAIELKTQIGNMQEDKRKKLFEDIYKHNYDVLVHYYTTIWVNYNDKNDTEDRAKSVQTLSNKINGNLFESEADVIGVSKAVINPALQLINWLSLGTLGGLNKLVLEIGKASGAKPFVGKSDNQILDSTARLHIFKSLRKQRRIAILESDLYHVLVKLYINIDNDNMKDLLLNKGGNMFKGEGKLEKKIKELKTKIPKEYLSSRTTSPEQLVKSVNNLRKGDFNQMYEYRGSSGVQTSSNGDPYNFGNSQGFYQNGINNLQNSLYQQHNPESAGSDYDIVDLSRLSHQQPNLESAGSDYDEV